MRTSLDLIQARQEVREPEREDWRNDAECVHHAGEVDFFPERGESVRAAKAICAECPVQSECLEYAMQWNHLSGSVGWVERTGTPPSPAPAPRPRRTTDRSALDGGRSLP